MYCDISGTFSAPPELLGVLTGPPLFMIGVNFCRGNGFLMFILFIIQTGAKELMEELVQEKPTGGLRLGLTMRGYGINIPTLITGSFGFYATM